MAKSTENEYPPEATIGDQWLRKDRGKIAEAVTIPSVSAARSKSVSRPVYHLSRRRRKFHDDKLFD